MDFITAIQIFMTALGAIVTLLGIISPFTKSTVDDKILLALKGFTNAVKVNEEEKSVLIQVK